MSIPGHTAPRRLRLTLAVALAALTVFVAACGGDDSSSSSGSSSGSASKPASAQSISLGFQQPYSSLPVYIAIEQGMLKDHGISKVDMVPFTDLPAMTTALARGQIDVGFQTLALLTSYNAQAKGSDFKLFSPGQAQSSYWVARKGAGIPVATGGDWESTVKSWRGKKVGVPALGGSLDLFTRYMIKQVGMDPDKDVSIVVSGVGPATLAALKSKAVDVVTGDAFSSTQITQSGDGDVVLNMLAGQGPALFQDTIAGQYFAPADRISGDQKLYSDFDGAVRDALAFMKDPANRDAVEQVLVKDIKVDPKVASALYETLGSFTDLDQLSQGVVDKTLDAYAQIGLIKPPAPAYNDVVATDLVNGDGA